MSDYLVIYEKCPTGYSAYVPDLPGCITTGATFPETEANMHEAMQGHLLVMREYGDDIPVPTTLSSRIAVAA